VDRNKLESVVPAFATFEGDMYSGLIPFDYSTTESSSSHGPRRRRQGELMFWLFVPTAQQVDETLVLWLNGGPGCSSFLGGVLFENGPVMVPHHPAGFVGTTATDPLVSNADYSWTRITTMLYIEQPAGTGFSHGPDPETEDDLSRDMYSYLQNFFTIFGSKGGDDDVDSSSSPRQPLPPQQQQQQDAQLRRRLLHLDTYQFFIFGESYAGYYVPSIARQIYLENAKLEETILSEVDEQDKIYIPLAGIALGNGWMEAKTQGSAIIDYAWWHGMIDTYTRAQLHREWKQCESTVLQEADVGKDSKNNDSRQVDLDSELHPFTIPDECGIMTVLLRAAGKGLTPYGDPNPYDITTWDTYPVLDSDNPQGTPRRFFNTRAVQEALHAPTNITWRGCIPGSGRRRRRRTLLQQDEQDNDESRSHTLNQEGRGNLHPSARKRNLFLLDHDLPESTAPYLAMLMDQANIRVLIYNGDRDLTTNSAGSELVLDQLTEWSGNSKWTSGHATRGLWMTLIDNNNNNNDDKDARENDTVQNNRTEFAGWVKVYQHLTFLVVYNSGHLVPFNLPGPSLDLLARFLSNTSFVDQVIPNYFDTAAAYRDSHASSRDDVDGQNPIDTKSTLLYEPRPGNVAAGLQWQGFLVGLLTGGLVVLVALPYVQPWKRGQYESIPNDFRLNHGEQCRQTRFQTFSLS
jgi:carboxypeptidase C (cathepsin A)